jgi:hypothetical protein
MLFKSNLKNGVFLLPYIYFDIHSGKIILPTDVYFFDLMDMPNRKSIAIHYRKIKEETNIISEEQLLNIIGVDDDLFLNINPASRGIITNDLIRSKTERNETYIHESTVSLSH